MTAVGVAREVRLSSYAQDVHSLLEKFSYKKVNSDELQEHLSIGKRLEKARKVFAYVIHVFT